jgi:hypothetical protein
MNSRAYVASFNFLGADQQKKVGSLSGGERNRVHLAKVLKQEANVILLDEPTNDLDVNTLRALEEALDNFAGCGVVVSHDRWFLDRVATHILAFGRMAVSSGSMEFSDYEADRKRRLGIAADTHTGSVQGLKIRGYVTKNQYRFCLLIIGIPTFLIDRLPSMRPTIKTTVMAVMHDIFFHLMRALNNWRQGWRPGNGFILQDEDFTTLEAVSWFSEEQSAWQSLLDNWVQRRSRGCR